MTKKEIIERYGEEEYQRRLEYHKQYYKQHIEEKKEYQKQYREQYREQIRERDKKYREQHKEEAKQYYQQHKEEINEQQRQYREQHKEESKKYRYQHKEEYKQWSRKNRCMFAYCIPEQIEQIENYQLAKKDNFNGWCIHHRLETHNSDGEKRLVNLSIAELKALDMYYNRPASELVFLTKSDHMKLHTNN